MKRKVASLSMVCLLAGANLYPAVSFADELTNPSEEAPANSGIVADSETNKTESTNESTATTETSTVDSTEAPESSTEAPAVSTEPAIQSVPTNQEKVQQNNTENSQLPDQKQATEVGIVASHEQEIKVKKNDETETFVKRIGEKARSVGQKNGLYASVMIAQAILESGGGSSELSLEPNYNLFGVKGEHEGKSVVYRTWEDDGTGRLYAIDAAFRKYPSYKESFEDYAKLMKEGIDSNKEIYSGTWKSNAQTYREATEALTGVYATDINYDKKLNAIIEEYELTEYDKEHPSTSLNGIIVSDSHPDSDFEEYSGQNYPGSEAYATGNCTQYVYNRIIQLSGYVETTMGNGMDWSATGKALGYEVSNTPKAGTAVSFQPGVAGADSTYGHVAFVEHVYEDGSILISEMNAAGLGIVSFRVIDKNTADTLAYITPK